MNNIPDDVLFRGIGFQLCFKDQSRNHGLHGLDRDHTADRILSLRCCPYYVRQPLFIFPGEYPSV